MESEAGIQEMNGSFQNATNENQNSLVQFNNENQQDQNIQTEQMQVNQNNQPQSPKQLEQKEAESTKEKPRLDVRMRCSLDPNRLTAETETHSLVIQNVDFSLTEDNVGRVFAQHGPIKSVQFDYFNGIRGI